MSEIKSVTFRTTPLHQAADAGDLMLCQELLREEADLTALDESGSSPLFLAVQSDHVDVARYFLQQGATIFYSYQREDNPASRTQEEEKARVIYENLGKLGIWDKVKENLKDLPLDLLEQMTSEKIMRDMRNSMVDLHFSPHSEHAIEYASSIPMLELLVIGYKADINHIRPDGYWPLSSFAESGDLAVVRWLLDHGADPNNTSTGETAIFKAIQNNQLEMISLLVERGANVKVQDVDGWTPLFACQSVEAATLLIEHGADPTITDQCDFPCWHWTKDPTTRDFLKACATKRGSETS